MPAANLAVHKEFSMHPWRAVWFGSFLIALAGVTSASEPEAKQASLKGTIDRGLAFLAKDAVQWRTAHKCASCHHAGLVVWALRDAKLAGYGVDEAVLADMTKWLTESGEGKTGVPRPAGIPKALNVKPVLYALALQADPNPDAAAQESLKRLLGTVKSDQTDSGAWASWPDTRPPIFGNSDESMTALATLSLLPAAAAKDAEAVAARDKGVKWLSETKTDDDPQSVAIRLVLWQRLGKPVAEIQALAARIIERQNADGGWSQAKEMASDAWATGQALYALSHAGKKGSDPAIERGRAFLQKTQREDGSWPMTSRPIKPGDKGATSLIPITGGGSSWGVIGLVRTRE